MKVGWTQRRSNVSSLETFISGRELMTVLLYVTCASVVGDGTPSVSTQGQKIIIMTETDDTCEEAADCFIGPHSESEWPGESDGDRQNS